MVADRLASGSARRILARAAGSALLALVITSATPGSAHGGDPAPSQGELRAWIAECAQAAEPGACLGRLRALPDGALRGAFLALLGTPEGRNAPTLKLASDLRVPGLTAQMASLLDGPLASAAIAFLGTDRGLDAEKALMRAWTSKPIDSEECKLAFEALQRRGLRDADAITALQPLLAGAEGPRRRHALLLASRPLGTGAPTAEALLGAWGGLVRQYRLEAKPQRLEGRDLLQTMDPIPPEACEWVGPNLRIHARARLRIELDPPLRRADPFLISLWIRSDDLEGVQVRIEGTLGRGHQGSDRAWRDDATMAAPPSRVVEGAWVLGSPGSPGFDLRVEARPGTWQRVTLAWSKIPTGQAGVVGEHVLSVDGRRTSAVEHSVLHQPGDTVVAVEVEAGTAAMIVSGFGVAAPKAK